MAKLKKPVSRLSLLFILMVIVSGVILTFLSINNITNFRILTEKKIQETQLEMAGQISHHFNQTLQMVTEDFSREWPYNNIRLPADSMFFTLQQIQVLPFSLNKNKNFIWPWYIETGQVSQSKISFPVQYDLADGESDEFQKEDNQKAFLHYYAALGKSRTSVDSARVLSALGRISNKLKDPDKSWYYYSSLFPRLSSEMSQVGMPYSYFAISQLIKLVIPKKQTETIELAGLFLEQLGNGSIPLNGGTETILEELNAWLTTLPVADEQNKRFHFLSEKVKSKLDFINNYRSNINEIVNTDKISELPVISDQFRVYPINKNDNPYLIIINTEIKNPKGFVISMNALWRDATSQLPKEIKSEYKIELVQGSTSQKSEDVLSIRAELSPYFPMHRIVIRPANEDVVEKFVRSRSWIYGIALVMLMGGMLLGIVLILRDINREKKMAEMQSEFVSHVTHELKTPLTSINMFAETIYLDRAKTHELRKKYANIIMKESEVLKRKIDNILEYSVRESEKSKYRIRETDLTKLVSEVMEEMKYWLDINEFEVTMETEQEVIANVDSDAIKQALSNMIGNAIKYSRDRKHLFVRLFRMEGKIMIEVEDTGIGIPKDQTGLIFEKFYRVNNHENESATGTGLGLSVTRDIVNAHGGMIYVESEINNGTKFTIQLNS